MPPARACDGEGLLAAFEEAAGHLLAHVDEINALNVFPVPDGDTGSNMAATVRAALDEAHRLPVAGRTLPAVAEALSFGALMGARGNSGVILSQIFRGMTATVAGRPRFDGGDFARALANGTETAYAAVVRPVEGTILTVVREAAVGAGEAAAHGPDTERILRAATSSAENAVAGTPDLLPILKQAGVVDAGGQGLYRLLEGALTATHRRHRRRGRRGRQAPPEPVAPAAPRLARPLAEAPDRRVRLRDDVPRRGARRRPRSTWRSCGTTSRRSADRSSSRAMRRRSRSMSTTSSRTRSSPWACGGAI